MAETARKKSTSKTIRALGRQPERDRRLTAATNEPTVATVPPADYDGPLCGFALYGEPALCTCGTCSNEP